MCLPHQSQIHQKMHIRKLFGTIKSALKFVINSKYKAEAMQLAPTCILLCNVIHKSMCFYISFQMKGDDWGHPNCWIKNWEVLQMFCTLWLGRWLMGLIGDDYQVFSTFVLQNRCQPWTNRQDKTLDYLINRSKIE